MNQYRFHLCGVCGDVFSDEAVAQKHFDDHAGNNPDLAGALPVDVFTHPEKGAFLSIDDLAKVALRYKKEGADPNIFLDAVILTWQSLTRITPDLQRRMIRRIFGKGAEN